MNGEQRNQPAEEDLRSAPVLPGFELPDVFPLSCGQLYTVGLQPEDHSALAFLKLRDPRKPATKEGLAEEMQAIGWKMGKTRFDGIFGRLKAAGHIKHVPVFNPETGRPQWQIQFFANPSYNDHYVNSVISASSRVGDETLETRDPQAGRPFETLETGIAQGQSESQVSGDTEANPRKPAFPSGDVPAGQGRNSGNPVFGASPPHPPEGGGGTPPPNPRTKGRAPKSDRYAEQCALDSADYQPTAEEIQAADAFLQDLPGKWQMGPDEARTLAPLLASRIHTQGYELDTYLELVLVQDDADKPATRPARVMPYRVRNLKRRRADEKPVPGAPAASSGLAEWCGVCNLGEMPAAVYQRTRELPDGSDVPCPECHPKFTRARG